MTLPRLQALRKYWRKHPKVDWLAAAYMKYKPPSDDPRAAPRVGTGADLANMFGLKPGMTFTG